MSRPLELVAAGLLGLLFGVGLLVAGMVQPANVVGFLDLFGDWKPALMGVMGGGIAVNAIGVLVMKRMGKPVLGAIFHVPTRRDLDKRLLTGAAIFGVGWAIGGFCPGPALVALPSGRADALLFVLAMLGGMALFNLWERKAALDRPAPPPSLGSRPTPAPALPPAEPSAGGQA
jgi:uncharacterized membrane protein YedE/YeeE